MGDQGSSATLIFYAIDRKNITSEPWLNIVAAAAQWSLFTHVEVAIGENAGAGGQMSNVLRVFNDDVVRFDSLQPCFHATDCIACRFRQMDAATHASWSLRRAAS